jgi:DNA-binding response OmpR family regulator
MTSKEKVNKEINKPTIVLAEDDKYISQAFKDGLERGGFQVITAADGEEAIAKIKEEKPDIVLLDLIMPIKDGFEVLQEIKGSKIYSHIPIIVFSNLEDADHVMRARELGASEYLLKANFTMPEVIAKVREYIKIKRINIK